MKPTGEQLLEGWREDSDDIEMVQEQCDPDDHGYAWTRIFKRTSDGTFWMCYGVNHGGGDYDTLRDDPECISVTQVWPHAVTVTEYRTVQPK